MGRCSSGATLALVIAVTIVLVLIGVFAFYVLQMLSGGRQTESAEDSGSLNVAKIAILAPSIQLNPNDPKYGAIDATIQAGVLKGSANVNLLNFNKIVAWGLLQAANAQADGNQKGIDNAHSIWLRIEGDQNNSLGALLKQALSSDKTQITSQSADVPSGSWPSAVFDSVAKANSTGFANSSRNQQITWQSFEVGYLGEGDSTNVQANYITSSLPYSPPDQTNTRITLTVDGKPWNQALTADGYVPGYVPVTVAKDNDPYYFVTVYHDQTPGLRTNSEFSKSTGQPGDGTVALPPNTFFNHASIVMQKTNSALAVGSPATVGTKAYPPIGSGPGYFILDNTPAPPFKGLVPLGCHDVTCDQLGDGIFILIATNAKGVQAPSYFSLDQSQLDQIKKWVEGGKVGAPPAVPDVYVKYLPSTSKWSETGRPVSADDLKRLNANDTYSFTMCTDNNSDVANTKADPNCVNYMTPFNNTYHPEGWVKGLGSYTAHGLTAAEMAKDYVVSSYCEHVRAARAGDIYIAGSVTLRFPPNPYKTGVAQYYDDANPITESYPPGFSKFHSIPWGTGAQFGEVNCCNGLDYINSQVVGKISKPFILPEIIDQTTLDGLPHYPYYKVTHGLSDSGRQVVKQDPGPGNRPRDFLYSYFSQRCLELGASQADIDGVWNKTVIDVGDVWYVYMDPQSNHLVASQQTPPGVTSVPGEGLLDGTSYQFYKRYSVLYSVVDAMYDFDIHDRPYTTFCTPGSLVAQDSITLEPDSGATTGCLGRIKFQQTLDNGGLAPPQLCEPN